MEAQRDGQDIRIFLLSAMAMRAAGNLLGAASAYREAIRIGTATGDAAKLSAAHDNLGNILADLGQLEEARTNYKKALGYETDEHKKGIILSNEARVLGEVGELRIAASVLRRRVTDLEAAGGGGELPIALDNAAMAMSRLGEYAEAKVALERAEEMLRQSPSAQRAVNALSLSNIHGGLGDLPAAARWFRTAHDLYFQLARQTIDIARYRRGFRDSLVHRLPPGHPVQRLFVAGVTQKDSGEWTAAAATLRQGAALARAEGDIALALRFMANEAALLFDRGQFEGSLESIRQVRDEASTLGLVRPEMMAMGTLASLLLSGADVNDPLGPLGLYIRTQVLSEMHLQVVRECQLDPATVLIETYDSGAVDAQLSKMAQAHHDFDLAIDYSHKAVVIARQNYQTMISYTPKGKIPTIPFELPNRLAGFIVAAKSGKRPDIAKRATDELATLIQRGGMTARGNLVAQRMLGDHYADSDAERAIGHFREACAAAEALKTQVLLGDGRADVARGHTDVFYKLARMLRISGRAADAFDALQGIKARRVTEAAAARAGASSDTLPRVQDAMRLLAGIGGPVPTVFVELVVEKTGLTAYLVDAAGARAVHVPADVSTGNAADRGDVNERPRRLVQHCLDDPALAALVRAVSAELPKQCRLLLSASGFLVNLPLHIVPLDGQPWCERFSISYIPAIGMLAYVRRDFTQADRVTVAGNSRNDLPHASAECTAIAGMLRSTPVIGADCSMANVLAHLRSGHHLLLHLALHGRGDSRRGTRASLLFAEPDGPRWIDLRNLFTRDVSIRLAVLSGCSTGVAGPLHGHELTGVARTAAEAGVSSIIACLWPVEDAVAEQFMTALYATIAAQRERGTIDLVEAFDRARAALQAWMASGAGPLGLQRNGRDLALGPGEDPVPPGAVADALAWAPFVLLGRPVLAEALPAQANIPSA